MKRCCLPANSYAVAAILICVFVIYPASAVPYATDLKYSGGTLSFRLNEPADNVTIAWANETQTIDLGPLPKGLFSGYIPDIFEPFKVIVIRRTPKAWTKISDDDDPNVRFNSPRGLAVNTRPASPYFGRVYISNSMPGSTEARSLGDGIYVLNSDQTDALGQGNDPLTAGLNFAKGGSWSPHRIKIGEDDTIYITDWSDAAGNLYMTDPNLSPGSGRLVFPALVPNQATGKIGVHPVGYANNHGSIDSVAVVGTLTKGNLVVYTVDEDLQTDREDPIATMLNSIWRYEIGAGPLPYSGDPEPAPFFHNYTTGSKIPQRTDLDRGFDGKFYLANCSKTGNEPGLYVIDQHGKLLWDSLSATKALCGEHVADLLAGTVSVALSPDGMRLAAISYYDNRVTIVEMSNGIPCLAKHNVFAPFGPIPAGRDIAFDAAGNIHVISSGYALYRVFSPGGDTIATTGSDGTFMVQELPAVVNVSAPEDSTVEGSPSPGSFLFTRSGDTSTELVVYYALEGTAINGTDYEPLTGTVAFPPGIETVTVPVIAVDDDLPELPETVVCTIREGQNYAPALPGNATITIYDNELPAVSITTKFASCYERTAGDYVVYQLMRLGDVSTEISVDITYAGSALHEDFVGPETVSIPAGTTTWDFKVFAIDNSDLDGDRSIIATITPGTNYKVGSPSSATATILDDELLSETGEVLFIDNFDADSAAQWSILWSASNIEERGEVLFGHDYYNLDMMPPAPDGSTLGLRLSVNRLDPVADSAVGVNLYPRNLFLSGNYAVRFNMLFVADTAADALAHVLFGINHSGSKLNWVRQIVDDTQCLPFDADGVWFAIASNPGDASEPAYVCYTGAGPANPAVVLASCSAADLASVFKAPPFIAGKNGTGGSPACSIDSTCPNWVDVEIRQLNDTITLLINRTVVLEVQNTTPYKSGTIMLGYSRQLGSTEIPGGVYFDNLRVVRLEPVSPRPPVITGVKIEAGQVIISFTAPGSWPETLSILSSTAVTGPYSPTPDASIQMLGDDKFQAVLPHSAPVCFYRVGH